MMIAALLAGAILGPTKGLLVVDMLAIGRYEAGKWQVVKPEPSDSVSKAANLDFSILNGVTTKGSIKVPKLEYQSDAAPGWYVTDQRAAGLVLWSGGPVKPSVVQPVSPISKVYLDAVQAFLREKGLSKAKARINQAISVDLDGDGTKEVLIEAATKADMTETTMNSAKSTDYTTVLLRYVKGGKVVTKEIAHHDGRSGVLEGADRLRAVCDLDGDGVAEIVVSSNYYEGTSASVFRFRKGVLTRLVENGSGV